MERKVKKKMLGYLSHPKSEQGVAFRKSDKELLMTDALTKLEKYTFSYNEDIFRGATDDIEDLVTMVNGYNDLQVLISIITICCSTK